MFLISLNKFIRLIEILVASGIFVLVAAVFLRKYIEWKRRR